jgi:hypothetical protein
MKRLAIVVALAGALLAAPAAEATWGMLPMRPPKRVPPDQSWLVDPPEKPGRGKIAVFEFKGDDVYQPVRAAVVRVLRRRGFNVTVALRQPDTAIEYREMSQVSNLVVYVAGDVKGEGKSQHAQVSLFSGLSGHRISYATFAGPTEKICADIAGKLWTRFGPTIARVREGVAKPRRQEREPLRIDAGDPVD